MVFQYACLMLGMCFHARNSAKFAAPWLWSRNSWSVEVTTHANHIRRSLAVRCSDRKKNLSILRQQDTVSLPTRWAPNWHIAPTPQSQSAEFTRRCDDVLQ